MTDSVPCGVARVEGLAFKAWMTLWWSSFAAFSGVSGFAALIILPCRSSAVVEERLVCVSMENWLLVGWLVAPSAGRVGESLFNSLINLVVVAVALCASSDEGVGDVFITLGSEMLLSLITHCKMSQLSKKFSGWLGDSPGSSRLLVASLWLLFLLAEESSPPDSMGLDLNGLSGSLKPSSFSGSSLPSTLYSGTHL